MAEEFEKVQIDNEFKICPNCGYEDGFHSMFIRVKGSNNLFWRFICPSCHKVYDIGLTASIT